MHSWEKSNINQTGFLRQKVQYNKNGKNTLKRRSLNPRVKEFNPNVYMTIWL